MGWSGDLGRVGMRIALDEVATSLPESAWGSVCSAGVSAETVGGSLGSAASFRGSSTAGLVRAAGGSLELGSGFS